MSITNEDFGEYFFEAYVDAFHEMERQLEKWGIQSHCEIVWLGILLEEIAETASEINSNSTDSLSKLVTEMASREDEIRTKLEDNAKGRDVHLSTDNPSEGYRNELVQVAAVALSALAAYDILQTKED